MEIKSGNPTVRAIIAGTAPRPAQMAAARGMLPLPQGDLLEILVALAAGADDELKTAAAATLQTQEANELLIVAGEAETAPSVLNYLARRPDLAREIHEAVIVNKSVPDEAVAALAAVTPEGALLDLIIVNQQRLIRHPALLDAILANPARTAEAERRARETRTEFFEKERGAQQIADELRAQGKNAAAEFIETAETFDTDPDFTYDDAILLASHIEVDDAEIDDSWFALEILDELQEESDAERALLVERMLSEAMGDGSVVNLERISLIRKIMTMKVKDRVKFALKGDREARNILIRDSNRLVATAVVKNPRITDQEVETIAAMRSVPDDVLRVISLNRSWMRLYSVTHNLARNPRTPVAVAMSTLPRLQMGDLNALVKNRNVSEGVRRQAQRLVTARKGN